MLPFSATMPLGPCSYLSTGFPRSRRRSSSDTVDSCASSHTQCSSRSSFIRSHYPRQPHSPNTVIFTRSRSAPPRLEFRYRQFLPKPPPPSLCILPETKVAKIPIIPNHANDHHSLYHEATTTTGSSVSSPCGCTHRFASHIIPIRTPGSHNQGGVQGSYSSELSVGPTISMASDDPRSCHNTNQTSDPRPHVAGRPVALLKGAALLAFHIGQIFALPPSALPPYVSICAAVRFIPTPSLFLLLRQPSSSLRPTNSLPNVSSPPPSTRRPPSTPSARSYPPPKSPDVKAITENQTTTSTTAAAITPLALSVRHIEAPSLTPLSFSDPNHTPQPLDTPLRLPHRMTPRVPTLLAEKSAFLLSSVARAAGMVHCSIYQDRRTRYGVRYRLVLEIPMDCHLVVDREGNEYIDRNAEHLTTRFLCSARRSDEYPQIFWISADRQDVDGANSPCHRIQNLLARVSPTPNTSCSGAGGGGVFSVFTRRLNDLAHGAEAWAEPEEEEVAVIAISPSIGRTSLPQLQVGVKFCGEQLKDTHSGISPISGSVLPQVTLLRTTNASQDGGLPQTERGGGFALEDNLRLVRLSCGKRRDEIQYTLDFAAPLSPVQAFAIALVGLNHI